MPMHLFYPLLPRDIKTILYTGTPFTRAGTPGPFDRTLGPQHAEGLSGIPISCYILVVSPRLPTGRQACRFWRDGARYGQAPYEV